MLTTFSTQHDPVMLTLTQRTFMLSPPLPPHDAEPHTKVSLAPQNLTRVSLAPHHTRPAPERALGKTDSAQSENLDKIFST